MKNDIIGENGSMAKSQQQSVAKISMAK